MVLESECSPRRGYCEIAGYGFSGDSFGVLCSGMVVAGQLAAARAHIDIDSIDCISAWGPGHKAIDFAEYNAMRMLFGDRISDIPVSSIKGSIGAALGAAPAIQVAAAAIGLGRQIVTPTANWRNPDPSCPFSLSAEPRFVGHRNVLVNAHGVGDVNSALILTEP